MQLKNPSCPLGYTDSDLAELLGDLGMIDFWTWMTGQTISLCDGRRYNHDSSEYEATECADSPHGLAVYRHDLERYLRGLPVIDW